MSNENTEAQEGLVSSLSPPSEIVSEQQQSNLNTICVLDAPLNGKVYLVGTAHFSLESQKEVSDLIRRVQPNRVVLELCPARVNILNLDEETVLREAKDMNVNKILKLIKETSVIHGLLQSLLIRLYAKVTEELGLAPGGEFRVAYKEAMQIPGCKVILGDMPINLTLSRGFHSLPWYRKLKLAWCLLTTNHKLTKEDVEQLKKSDLLDAMLKEFGASFPEFKRVLIDERDMYLTSSLRNAYQPVANEFVPGGFVPAVVVGVIGLGHIGGIKNNWEKEIDLTEIIKNPKPNERKYSSRQARFVKLALIVGTITVVGLQLYKRKFR